MSHEVMVLDDSGPVLGMIHYGAALKLFLFAALIVRVAMPFSLRNAWLHTGVFVIGMLLLAVFIGVVESVMAVLRPVPKPPSLGASRVLSGVSFILRLSGGHARSLGTDAVLRCAAGVFFFSV